MKQTEYRPFSNLYTVCCGVKEVDLLVIRVKPQDHRDMIYMLSHKIKLTESRVCNPTRDLRAHVLASEEQDVSDISCFYEGLLVNLIELDSFKVRVRDNEITLQESTARRFSSTPRSKRLPFDFSMFFMILNVHMLKSFSFYARSLKTLLTPFICKLDTIWN